MMSNEMLSKPKHAMWSTVIEASRNRNETKPDGIHYWILVRTTCQEEITTLHRELRGVQWRQIRGLVEYDEFELFADTNVAI